MIPSILLIVILGMLASRLVEKLGLPRLLEMIGVGIAVRPYGLDLLDSPILQNATDIRLIALFIIFLRAGFGLEKDLLRNVGPVAPRMSAIPCLLEGLTITAISCCLLALPLAEAGMLGFILAAVSSAVIVPAVLQLEKQGWSMRRGVPVMARAGASVDDVFAITLFTIFLGMGTQQEQY